MSGHQDDGSFFSIVGRTVYMFYTCLILTISCFFLVAYNSIRTLKTDPPPIVLADTMTKAPLHDLWVAPDLTLIPLTPEGDLIRYGKELIAHTSRYLGPRGSVSKVSNGMNCQNCHLKAGTKPFGNNYAAVVSTYPRFRARSGSIETIEKRINDCIERSLNGQPLDARSREMHAIIAWFKWLGADVKKGITPKGTGLMTLPFLSRAADPVKGKAVYRAQCMQCHGIEGEGYRHPDSVEWRYPPLAGAHSYNTGAGLYRLSRLAGYVKSNMPYGTTWDKPVLTDEEAWDVAAYVNSLPRPQGDFPTDWPDISSKPFDHPFGPYADSFSEHQHKFGPFGIIENSKSKSQN